MLITLREIKAMVTLIASKIINNNIDDDAILTRLATEVAYDITRQTLADHPAALAAFDDKFPSSERLTWSSHALPKNYEPYQREAYCLIKDMLQARETILSHN